MRKRITPSVFITTFFVSLFCLSVIALTEYLATETISNGWIYVAVVLVIPLIVTTCVQVIVKNNIIKPVNNINIEAPDVNSVYSEFTPLIEKIDSQNKRIISQMEAINHDHSSKDKLRREFTANVSHELKTPLTSISGYAEIIQSGIAKPEDTVRFAGKIYDESQRLITLVQDILNLSQLEERDIERVFTNIELYSLCESVISRLESIAKKRNITFSLSGDKCCINGVINIIEEMVYNLCDNAVKYNKDNGKVDVAIRQCIDGVELSVADTGIGMETKELTRIFERFYRVDKSHSKEIGGTGLGLSIVKHAALYHKASISVDSEINKGTTIKILF